MDRSIDNLYLLRRIEEATAFYSRSYSNRYSNWKRIRTICNLFGMELKLRAKPGQCIKVLEIGCGDGWLVYKLKTLFDDGFCLDFTGIDISGLDIDFANKRKEYFDHKNCDFKVMDVQSLSFMPEEFDIIISSEVMEHIEEPKNFLASVYGILKKDGLIILTTPQLDGSVLVKSIRSVSRLLRIRIDRVREKMESASVNKKERPLSRFSSSGGKTGAGLDHVSVHSVSEWKKMFSETGFKTVCIRGAGGMLFGTPFLDEYRVFFALTMIADAFLEPLPFSYIFSENLLFGIRKKL